MKKIFMSLILSTLTSTAFGAKVISAKLDASQKYILIKVQYTGGCDTHDFSLDVKGCLETFPVQCSAFLIENTKDSCKKIVLNTAVIPLSENNLNDSYYHSGTLSITGSDGSSAHIVLPSL